MKIVLHNFEREEIIEWLQNKTQPTRLTTGRDIGAFRRRAKKFVYISNNGQLMYKLGLDNHLRFFTLEESVFKKDFILLKHVDNGHAGRDRLYHLLISVVYGVTRSEVMDLVKSCEICQSRRALVTRPVIRPIIAVNPRERYIADLVDLRYYEEENDGYKWLLVVVDSFSKYMWTVPLQDKSGQSVVSAIKTIFMVNGCPFLLHTDNGREFCNRHMVDMLAEFNTRHIRGRARCPWIQGQVERANQTIKWMIGSMLMSMNIIGRWTTLREDATYAYNTLRHSTTSKTPFVLMFGPPIRQLMEENLIESLLNDEVNECEEEIDDDEILRDDILPLDLLNANQLPSLLPEDMVNTPSFHHRTDYINIRNDARDATQYAANRMIARSMWRNDFLEFNVGTRVLIRPDTDNNEQTRVRSLYEHLNRKVYRVTEILQHNKVSLVSDDGEMIESIDIIRLKRFDD